MRKKNTTLSEQFQNPIKEIVVIGKIDTSLTLTLLFYTWLTSCMFRVLAHGNNSHLWLHSYDTLPWLQKCSMEGCSL